MLCIGYLPSTRLALVLALIHKHIYYACSGTCSGHRAREVIFSSRANRTHAPRPEYTWPWSFSFKSSRKNGFARVSLRLLLPSPMFALELVASTRFVLFLALVIEQGQAVFGSKPKQVHGLDVIKAQMYMALVIFFLKPRRIRWSERSLHPLLHHIHRRLNILSMDQSSMEIKGFCINQSKSPRQITVVTCHVIEAWSRDAEVPRFPWQPSLLTWQQAPLRWQPRPEC